MPCYSTYSRVLGQAVRVEQLEQCVGAYLTACSQEPLPGFSRPETGLDFRAATCFSCGHGRSEKRTLTASSALKGYTDWPGLEQVFCYTCNSTTQRTGEVTHHVTYGVTSLTAREAGPERLLEFVPGHWGMESGCHYRRDVTLHEDNGQLEVGRLAQVMACLNNLVLGLTIGQGQTWLPEAQRHYDAHPDEALALILLC